MNYSVIFKVGELCKWRCSLTPEEMGEGTNITTNKWYDANVHLAFGLSMTLYVVNDIGEPIPVPHYAYGEWKGASEIGILDPVLAESRMREYIQKQISEQKAQHQTRMQKLRHEMRSIKIEGFVDESAVPVETNK
ncbi:hypothetical protein D9M71_495900 [compost metagenome]